MAGFAPSSLFYDVRLQGFLNLRTTHRAVWQVRILEDLEDRDARLGGL